MVIWDITKYPFFLMIKRKSLSLVLLACLLSSAYHLAFATYPLYFNDIVDKFLEVFMDDFSFFGNSFDHCLANLKLLLQRCEEKNLVLNSEKCHLMVKEGIVLGHRISPQGLEVDRAKIETI